MGGGQVLPSSQSTTALPGFKPAALEMGGADRRGPGTREKLWDLSDTYLHSSEPGWVTVG